MTTNQVISPVSGVAAPGFEPLVAEFGRAIRADEELGASLAVRVDGKTIVDIWGGWRTTARDDAWQVDTVVNVWSASKVVSVIAVLRLVTLGALDLDLPVAHYWPEFGHNGKSGVLLRHVLAHSSGVSGWDAPFGLSELYDTELAFARLADQAPWWQPGTGSGYHAITQGVLLDAIVRRACGRSLADVVEAEFRDGLNADFQFGTGQIDTERIAEIEPAAPASVSFPDDFDRTIMTRTFTQPRVVPLDAMTQDWRAARLPAVNGHTHARALATIADALANEGLAAGRELIGPSIVRQALTPQTSGRDLVLGTDITWGLGLAASSDNNPAGLAPGPRWYWGGWGGSLVVIDPPRRLTFAYTMNRMSPDLVGSTRSRRYVSVLDECLHPEEEHS